MKDRPHIHKPISRLFGEGAVARAAVMQSACNAYGKECLLQGARSKDHPACGANGGPYSCGSCLHAEPPGWAA